MAEFAINASSNASTGFAPFELIYSHMPKMCLTAPPSDYPGVNDFAQKAKENLMAAHNAIIHNRAAQTIQANKKRCPDPPLRKGELAYLSMDKLNLPKGRAGKAPIHRALRNSGNISRNIKLRPQVATTTRATWNPPKIPCIPAHASRAE